MIYRVIDKATGLFIRDDFTFDEAMEIGLDVEPSQGFIHPKWEFDTQQWVEGATPEEISALQQQPEEPTLEERLNIVEDDTEAIAIVLADIVGVQV